MNLGWALSHRSTAELWCGRVVKHHVHVQIGGYFGVELARERHELSDLVAQMGCADDLPVVRSSAA
jgi:hypothetical protein